MSAQQEASDGSAPSLSSRAKSEAFWTSFNARIQDAASSLEKASKASELEAVVPLIASMRSDLTAMTEFLPSYDRSAHEANLASLTANLQKRQAELKPKQGFAFKRKPKAAAPPAASVEPSSSKAATQASSSSAAPSTSTSTHASLSDRAESLLVPSDISGLSSSSESPTSSLSDLHLSRLESCIVDLRPSLSGSASGTAFGAVQVRDVKRSVLILGQVQGSIMLHDVQDTLVVARSRQFRMHRSTRCSLILSTDSVITLEDCHSFVVASVPPSATSRLSLSAGGRESTATSSPPPPPPPPLRVQDFSHVNPDRPSPNWRALSEAEAQQRLSWAHEALTKSRDGGAISELLSRLAAAAARE